MSEAGAPDTHLSDYGELDITQANDETTPQRSENARIDYFIQPSNYERSTSSVQQQPSNHVIQRRQQEISEASHLRNKKTRQHRNEPSKDDDEGINVLTQPLP